jgi:hypothetical protein
VEQAGLLVQRLQGRASNGVGARLVRSQRAARRTSLPQLLPEDVLQWTEGSLELVQVAQFFLHKIMPEAISEAVSPMEKSEFGRQIAAIAPPKWTKKNWAGSTIPSRLMWDAPKQRVYSRNPGPLLGGDRAKEHGLPPQPVWHVETYLELQDMIAEHLQKDSAWWKANATRFRQHANALRTVRKIQTS